MTRVPSIIVTADDFGIGRETSRGIIEAHRSGPVTSISAMVVTGDHLSSSVGFLESAPNLDVGLHVVLTRCGHRPLVATRASGLVDRDGQFFSNARLWMRAFLGRIDRRAVADEIVAQGERFKTVVGRAPTHVDSHHHCHQLPGIREALMEVIARGALPRVVRTTVEADCMRAVPSAPIRRRATRFIGNPAARVFAAAGLSLNDSFFGMLDPGDLAKPFPWQSYFDHLPADGTIEWVVHPGFEDETLAGRDDYRAERRRELECLTSKSAQARWEKMRPQLRRKSECFAAGVG